MAAPPTNVTPTHDEVVRSTREVQATMVAQKVPINAYESPDAIVVIAPFPAVQPEDVIVEVQGSKLRMFGELRTAPPRDYLVQEWEYGGYEREFDLPDGFGGSVEASLANGQLAVRVLRGNQSESPIRITPVATGPRNNRD